MELLIGVQVVKPKQQLPHNNGNVVLPEQTRLQQISAAAPGAELHDDPELGAPCVGAMVLGDVGRLQLGENGNLLYNILDLVDRTLNIDNLDGNGLTGSLVDAVETPPLARSFGVPGGFVLGSRSQAYPL
jgi:hypothetical protein